MLAELSVSPSIFYDEAYHHPAEQRECFKDLQRIFMEAALTHNHWNGSFTSHTERDTKVSIAGKKMLKAMKIGKRFIAVPPSSSSATKPVDPRGWTKEAIESRQAGLRVDGILTCSEVKAEFADNDLVAAVQNRDDASWWNTQIDRHSWNAPRSAQEYVNLMRPLVLHASYLKIVDSYFNPSREEYQPFVNRFVAVLSERPHDNPKPMLEFHCSCYPPSNRTPRPPDEIERSYQPLSEALRKIGLKAEVHIWWDTHNRHLLTNLGGYLLGNSLSNTTDPEAEDDWVRLNNDLAQRRDTRYTPNVRPKRLYHSMHIGGASR